MTDLEKQAREDIRQRIIRQLGDDPNADRVILPGTDWDIVLGALAFRAAQPGEGISAREMLAREYDRLNLTSEAKRLRINLGCELSAEKAALNVIGRLAYLEAFAEEAGLALAKPRPDREAVVMQLEAAKKTVTSEMRDWSDDHPSKVEILGAIDAAILSLLPAEPVHEMREGEQIAENANCSGWIVTDGGGETYRTWQHGFSGWTKDRDKATRYARRQDAEAVHAEDEDAWRVIPFGPSEDGWREERERLRAALEPFARIAEFYDEKEEGDDFSLAADLGHSHVNGLLKLGLYRAAARALSEPQEQGGEK